MESIEINKSTQIGGGGYSAKEMEVVIEDDSKEDRRNKDNYSLNKRSTAQPLQFIHNMEIQNQSSLQKISNWLKESILIKLLAIGFLVLILLIPNSMISDMIREREFRQNEVEQEVNQSWGGSQDIIGPVLSIPYSTFVEWDDGKVREQNHMAYILPEELNVDGDLSHQIRKRSIFDVILYQSEFKLSGSFELSDFEVLHMNKEHVKWEEAKLSVGIRGMTGIKEMVEIEWGEASLRMEPGTANPKLLRTGVSVNVPISNEEDLINFNIPIKLNGSGHFHIEPVGKSTNVNLRSDWNSPSFDGAFLPDNRTVSESGFDASWQVLNLNRPYPQHWIDDAVTFGGSAFGVKLIQPVDEYAKNNRSAKYAILIIGLTFLLYFFFEVLQKLLIHPFQYLLVGLAITVFYLLLLSLSEHLGFDVAYLISAVATITLICGYSWSFLGLKKLVFQLFLLLIGIYGFIFTLLQLEDFALLAGSIGVFIALAVVMYASRKVNWYNLGERTS